MQREMDIILEICGQLAEQENLKVCLVESAKGAGIVGASTFLGGVLGGRNGLLIGGALGIAAGYFLTSDFKSILQILREDLTEEQRKSLCRRVKSLLGGRIKDVGSVMGVLAGNAGLKNKVLSAVNRSINKNTGWNVTRQ